MTQLIVAPEAESDMEAILRYLEEQGGVNLALRYGDGFRVALRHLLDFPGSGSPRPQFGDTMRVWLVPPYVLFYRFGRDDDTVRLLRVLHGRRNAAEEILGKHRLR